MHPLRKLLRTESEWNPKVILGRAVTSLLPESALHTLKKHYYGYLLTHYAISALICQAATEADIDPDRVKFTRTVRIVRRQAEGPAAFSP